MAIPGLRYIEGQDDPAFIRGLNISCSGSTVTVGAGAAYVESVKRIVSYAGGTTSQSVSFGDQYYVYLNSSGLIVLSLSAPNSTPYAGTARSNVSNTALRFLGTAFAYGTISSLINYMSDGGANVVKVTLRHNTGSTSRLVSNGTSTGAADVSLTQWAPPNATVTASVRIMNISSTSGQIIQVWGWNGAAFGILTNQASTGTNPGPALIVPEVACDTTPKIQYAVPSGNSGFLDLMGYTYQR